MFWTAEAQAAEYHSTEQVAIAAFPEGAQVLWDPEWRFPLGHSEHVLLKGNHIAFIPHMELTPSFPRGGPVIRFAPVAVWDAAIRLQGTWFLGAFSSLLPLPSPDFVADRAAKRALIAAGERDGGWGLRLDLTTRFKMKLGPVIGLVEFEARRHHVRSWDGELAWFWEPTENINLPADGWSIHRNAYLLVEAQKPIEPDDKKLWLGAYFTWASCAATADRNVRLGPLLMWHPADGYGVPTLLAGSQVWIESRFAPTLPPYTFLAANWSR